VYCFGAHNILKFCHNLVRPLPADGYPPPPRAGILVPDATRVPVGYPGRVPWYPVSYPIEYPGSALPGYGSPNHEDLKYCSISRLLATTQVSCKLFLFQAIALKVFV